jgi:hypothetical protein
MSVLFPHYWLCRGSIQFGGEVLQSDLSEEGLASCRTMVTVLRAGADSVHRHVPLLDEVHELRFGLPSTLGAPGPVAPFNQLHPWNCFNISRPDGKILAISLLVPEARGKEFEPVLALLAHLSDCASPENRQKLSSHLSRRPALLTAVLVGSREDEARWWDLLSFAMTVAAVVRLEQLPAPAPQRSWWRFWA